MGLPSPGLVGKTLVSRGASLVSRRGGNEPLPNAAFRSGTLHAAGGGRELNGAGRGGQAWMREENFVTAIVATVSSATVTP